MRVVRWSVRCPRGRLLAARPVWAMAPAALQAAQHLDARCQRAAVAGWCPLPADAPEPRRGRALGSAPHAVGSEPGSAKRAALVPRRAVVVAGPVRAAAAPAAGSAVWAPQALAQPPEAAAEQGAPLAAGQAGLDAQPAAEAGELVARAAQPRAEAAWDAQVRHRAAAREDAEPERLAAERGAAQPGAARPSAGPGAVSEPPSAAASVCRRGRLLPVVPAP